MLVSLITSIWVRPAAKRVAYCLRMLTGGISFTCRPLAICGLVASTLVLAPAAATAAEIPVVRIMPLGDSLTDGSVGSSPVPGAYRIALEDLLLADGYNFDFVGQNANGPAELADQDWEGRGSPGADIAWIKDNLNAYLAANPADVVLLMIGSNDLDEGPTDVPAVAQAWEDLVRAIHAHPASPQIITTTLPPMTGEEQVWQDAAAQINEFNGYLPGRASTMQGDGVDVTLVDAAAALEVTDLVDNQHLSRDGYDKLAGVWFDGIAATVEPPQVLVSDDFDRADGPLGPPWTSHGGGTWGVVGNQAAATNGSGEMVTLLDAGSADVHVSANLTLSSGTSQSSLALRAQDESTQLILALIVDDRNRIDLTARTLGGGYANLARIDGAGLVPGQTYDVAVRMERDEIEVFIDGVSRIRHTLSVADQATFGGLTGMGMRTFFGTGAEEGGSRWDDFVVRAAASPPPECPEVPEPDPAPADAVVWDSFNREPGPLGTPDVGTEWDTSAGSAYRICDGTVRADRTGSGEMVALTDAGTADATVRAEVTLSAGTSQPGLSLRALDADNQLIVAMILDGGRNRIDLTKRDSGVFSNLARIDSAGLVGGQTYVLDVRMDGPSIEVLLDGLTVIDHTMSEADQATFGANTLMGLRTSLSSTTEDGGSRWDDFAVVAAAPSTPAPTGLTVTPRPAGAIELTWTAPEGATPISYNVYRSAASGTPGTLVGSPTATAFDDTPPTDGEYFYVVKAVYDAGESEASNEGSAISDRIPPTVTIGSGPSGTVNSTTASFEFSTSEPATFVCALDGATAQACTSPQGYPSLADGSHTFTVTGTDAAGNSGEATRAWTVDTTPTPPPSGGGGGGGTPPPSNETPAGGTESTDPDGTEPTDEDPVVASITTPNAGVVELEEIAVTGIDGYLMVPLAVDITAPDATSGDPLVIEAKIDASALLGPLTALTVFRDGVAVPGCTDPNAGVASPDPCVADISSTNGIVTVRVLTSQASVWAFGVPTVTRIAGADRIATAIETSRAGFGAEEATAAVLARADLFPDALAGGALAVAEGGPLLLTESDVLDAPVAAELERVVAAGGTVHLLGGPAALSEDVAAAVAALGFAVERHGGDDRFETAIAIAEATTAMPAAIMVTTGANFPDALAASAAAADLGGVVVLTDGDVLPSPVADYLAAHDGVPTYAIGGPATRALPTASPIAGADRYATATAVAVELFPGATVFGVATGMRFPDALSAGARMGRLGAPLLLVGDFVPDGAADLLTEAVRAELFGGSAVISAAVETEIDLLVD